MFTTTAAPRPVLNMQDLLIFWQIKSVSPWQGNMDLKKQHQKSVGAVVLACQKRTTKPEAGAAAMMLEIVAVVGKCGTDTLYTAL